MPTCLDFCRDNKIIGPIAENIVAPFVKMTITGANVSISVGNNSGPDSNNTACIKSFQYGQQDGCGAEVEVFDEAGGAFAIFAQYIIKKLDDPPQVYEATVEWGWILSDCDGSTNVRRSRPHVLIITTCDINFSAGGMTFKIGLIDKVQLQFESTQIETFGEDLSTRGMGLKEAIKKLFASDKTKPRVDDVAFIRIVRTSIAKKCDSFVRLSAPARESLSPGIEEEFEFENFSTSKDGPKYKWDAGNNSALAAVRAWIDSYTTKSGKGIIIFWDSVKNRLVFLESPLPACPSSNPINESSIGTYIVNGGRLSPVIEFRPQIKWTFAAAAQSGAAMDPEGKSARMQGPAGCDDKDELGGKGVGSSSRPTKPDDHTAAGGTTEDKAKATAAHEQANKPAENIEAELRIQGDPTLDDPFGILTQTVALMVVNPFHLRGPNADGCPEWLVEPPCNNCLSNRNWIIKGVSHEIKQGSYVTTLKVLLPRPCDNNDLTP